MVWIKQRSQYGSLSVKYSYRFNNLKSGGKILSTRHWYQALTFERYTCVLCNRLISDHLIQKYWESISLRFIGWKCLYIICRQTYLWCGENICPSRFQLIVSCILNRSCIAVYSLPFIAILDSMKNLVFKGSNNL